MVSETIELRGHIIDSLILPKVLDEILKRGGTFQISEVRIGQNRVDQSYARVEVSSEHAEALDEILLRLKQHGAEAAKRVDAQLAPAPADGVFPDEFYVTTNQQTLVRLGGKEIPVAPNMMDSAIAVDASQQTARALKFYDVRRGDQIIVGHQGIRVVPLQRDISTTNVFQFINTIVPAETPKSGIVRELAAEFRRAKGAKEKILVVAGPAIVHAGAGGHLEKLIEWGYVDRLFTGNALAVYDVESVLYGTSLGVSIERGALVAGGHENHMRAINAIRAAGGIREAVEKKILTHGIMHACVKHGVDILLSGSIRDNGPIPGVNTDVIEMQKLMRDKLGDVRLALMMGSLIHSIAVANLAPSTLRIVCVDINAANIAQLTDQRTLQSIGLVTDIEPFLRELTRALDPAAA